METLLLKLPNSAWGQGCGPYLGRIYPQSSRGLVLQCWWLLGASPSSVFGTDLS